MSPAGQRQRFLAGSVIAGVLSVIFLLWIVLRIDGPRVTDGVDDIGEATPCRLSKLSGRLSCQLS